MIVLLFFADRLYGFDLSRFPHLPYSRTVCVRRNGFLHPISSALLESIGEEQSKQFYRCLGSTVLNDSALLFADRLYGFDLNRFPHLPYSRTVRVRRNGFLHPISSALLESIGEEQSKRAWTLDYFGEKHPKQV